jgi:hypothetical protein
MAVGVYQQHSGITSPYICVQGLVEISHIDLFHRVFTQPPYWSYRDCFKGFCYRREPVEMANTERIPSTLVETPWRTLCGATISDFPRGSGRSATIGGVLDINGTAVTITNGHVDHTNSPQPEPVASRYPAQEIRAADYESPGIILDNLELDRIPHAPMSRHHSSTDLPQEVVGHSLKHGTEWSTIGIKDGSLRLPNIYEATQSAKTSNQTSERWYLNTVAARPLACEVIIMTSHEGSCHGRMLTKVSYLCLPSGKSIKTMDDQLRSGRR